MAVKITLSIATGRKHYDDEGSELSVLTCKAITREISSLPGVSDNNRADSWRWRRRGISDDDGADSWHRGTRFCLGFDMQSNNMGDLTLTGGFRCRAGS